MIFAEWTLVLLLVTLFSTFFCAAINAYTVQVAYPLWRSVKPEAFAALHQEYLRRLWPVITVPHVVMFFSSAALIRWHPSYLTTPFAAAVFGLNAAVVLVSMFGAGPIHTRFEKTGQIDEAGFRALLRISALRTCLMLLSSGLLSYVLFGQLEHSAYR